MERDLGGIKIQLGQVLSAYMINNEICNFLERIFPMISNFEPSLDSTERRPSWSSLISSSIPCWLLRISRGMDAFMLSSNGRELFIVLSKCLHRLLTHCHAWASCETDRRHRPGKQANESGIHFDSRLCDGKAVCGCCICPEIDNCGCGPWFQRK